MTIIIDTLEFISRELTILSGHDFSKFKIHKPEDYLHLLARSERGLFIERKKELEEGFD